MVHHNLILNISFLLVESLCGETPEQAVLSSSEDELEAMDTFDNVTLGDLVEQSGEMLMGDSGVMVTPTCDGADLRLSQVGSSADSLDKTGLVGDSASEISNAAPCINLGSVSQPCVAPITGVTTRTSTEQRPV